MQENGTVAAPPEMALQQHLTTALLRSAALSSAVQHSLHCPAQALARPEPSTRKTEAANDTTTQPTQPACPCL